MVRLEHFHLISILMRQRANGKSFSGVYKYLCLRHYLSTCYYLYINRCLVCLALIQFVLPVTTATAERSFSNMRPIKKLA